MNQEKHKMKSSKNKTIDIPLANGKELLALCECPPTGSLTPSDTDDRFFNADFFDICRRLPEKYFDLVIADPPYNLTKDYAGEIFAKQSDAEYESFTRQWLAEVKRLMKDDATLYVCCDWKTGIIMGRVLGDFFTIRNRITWQREKGRGVKANWKNSMEDIWFCTVSEKYKFDLDAVKMKKRVIAPYTADGKPKDWYETEAGRFRDTCPSNFWDDITVPFWSMDENTAHPTQKPEKLMAKLILASSETNDRVLDPFGGSGTTAVTAKKLGRKYTSAEKNPQFCIWAAERLKRADNDKTIQGYENGIFLSRNENFTEKKREKKAKTVDI